MVPRRSAHPASNFSAEQMFAWPHDELIGRQSTVLIPDEHRESHLEGMKAAAAQLRQYGGNWLLTKRGLDLTGLRRDGQTLPITVEIRAIKYGDEIEFIVSMKRTRAQEANEEVRPLPEIDVKEKPGEEDL